ncbi:LuxR family transcriptional regulator [Acinetobacter guerrae]|uniref:LuxR family transcriptional regulator n=1 Tax=Acinetobacter guerrae TaxID=1843371 RepID=A0A3A8E8A6_9GAMM|nr:helix-turn-helix transcriptional regulator [Acinetobacter guerrae]RKG31037.1 LuxR family transcriptional regulator [Acinetobacter guerrae]
MNFNNNDYEDLVESIYQIPLSQHSWFSFAKKLLNILDASYVHIQAIDFSHQVLSFSNGVGPLPLDAYAKAELDYLRYPVEADPRWEKFLDPQRQGWYQCHTHITDSFVDQSELYQHILLSIDLRYVASHELIWDEKICVFLSISTSLKRQPLNHEELAFLDRLIPHLKRIVNAQRHLYEFSSDHIIGYSLIDKLTQPILLLNLAGQIVHHNSAMQFFLEKYPFIHIVDRQLNLPEVDQLRFINILYQLEEIFRYKPHELDHFKNIIFLISQTQIKFNIDLLASEKEKSFFGTRPLLMLSFEELLNDSLDVKQSLKDDQYYLCEHYLKQQYQLTKREFELCYFFVNGMSLEQMTQKMGLTKSSIRTYLRNIFLKMSCNSRLELMQLLIKISRYHSKQ